MPPHNYGISMVGTHIQFPPVDAAANGPRGIRNFFLIHPRSLCAAALFVAIFFSWGAASLRADESEIIVSRTAAGQLKVDIDFAQPFELEPSIFPGISGYATGLLGVHSTILDDTNNDSFQLSTEADFRFILLAKDPGMEISVFTNNPENYFRFMNIGESFYIGPAPFDTHPIWNLVNGTPGNAHSLTLKLRDLNGVYPDSAPFVLSFTIAPVYQLQIQKENLQHVTLSWPTNAVDWALESAGSVAPANWLAVTNSPVITGTNYVLSLVTANLQQFFRLHKL